MPQIRSRIKTSQANPADKFQVDLQQELLSFSMELSQILNKGLKFSDNFNGEEKTIADSGNADTKCTIAHTLKRIPTGFTVLKIDKPGSVYASGTTWTDTDVYLKCSAANAAITVMIF
jgi:hypothetical protein